MSNTEAHRAGTANMPRHDATTRQTTFPPQEGQPGDLNERWYDVGTVRLHAVEAGEGPLVGLGAYRVSELAQDVVGLIHACGEERAVVAGHDWGGALAWAVGIRHPAVVRPAGRVPGSGGPRPGHLGDRDVVLGIDLADPGERLGDLNP